MKGRLRICRGWCTCFDHGSPSDRVIINPLFPCHGGQIPHMKEPNLYSLMSLRITQDPGPVWVSEIWDTGHFSFLYHTLSPSLNSAQPGLYLLSKTNKAKGFSWRAIIYSWPLWDALLFSHLSRIQLFGTPWTVACQAPLVCGVFPGSNSGVDCHFFLQGIFPIQGSNLHLLHWQTDSLALSHQGSPSRSPNQPQIIFLALFSDNTQDLATYHSYCLQACIVH